MAHPLEHAMSLNLRALAYPPALSPRNISARFTESGGRIGRDASCTLHLPDANRYVSRQHVEVRFRNGAVFLSSSRRAAAFRSMAEA